MSAIDFVFIAKSLCYLRPYFHKITITILFN